MSVSGVLGSTWAGVRRRCPRCRRGRMFQGFYDMRERCERCGYLFEPSPGEFTGGLMLAQGGLGLLAVVGFLVLRARRAPTIELYAWIGLVLVVVPLLFYPNIKGAWLGFLHGIRGARSEARAPPGSPPSVP